MKTRVCLKYFLNDCRSFLFHMKTRVCLKYFFNDCRSSVWSTKYKTTNEGTQLGYLTIVHRFHELTSQPTHLLPHTSSCIDLIFSD